MYANVTNANNLASITIQRNGRIRSVRWVVRFNDATNGHTADIELSMQPVGQTSVHDTIGQVDMVSIANQVGAAGTTMQHVKDQSVLDFPVGVGERVYLNAVTTLTSCIAHVFLDVAEGP